MKKINIYKWLFWALVLILVVMISLPLHLLGNMKFMSHGGAATMPDNELIEGQFTLSNDQTTALVNDYFKANNSPARFYMSAKEIDIKVPIKYMGFKIKARFKASVEDRENGDLRLHVKEVKMSKFRLPITLALTLLQYTDLNQYVNLHATKHIVDISSEKLSNKLDLLIKAKKIDQDGLTVSTSIPYAKVKALIKERNN
ncbi:DUF2140 family protein [Atopobacter sp. AH10]|uniref:DUF2140 family protein n=1 Tax=Atopobacter sp. AH10 TaxID=2315861 RepID=UPI000EF1D4AE|nr:DUF2140 family protein [Atopobacter sp. AH10]RLK63399.1 DUF2140 family protein [Atopobacter sp. AH10]